MIALVNELLSQKVQAIKPSGIRKFFDIAATMQDVISWAWASRISPPGGDPGGGYPLHRGKGHQIHLQLRPFELRQAISRYLASRFQVSTTRKTRS